MQRLKKFFLGRDSGGPREPLADTSTGDRPQSAPPQALPAAESTVDEKTLSASWRDPSAFATEAERLALLQSMQVLKTPPESRFDCITRLMAAIFETPVALVSLSGSDTLWFKSIAGEFGSCLKRAGSFCDIIMQPDEPEVCLLEDLATDSRFSAHPNVAGAPFLRFYAGAPLVGSTGHRYGTLCILDVKPRTFPAAQLNTLVNFAELVTRELEMGAGGSSVGSGSARSSGSGGGSVLDQAEKVRPPLAFEDPVALLDLAAGDAWPLMYANDAWGREAAVPTYPICLLPPQGPGGSSSGGDLSSAPSSSSSYESSKNPPRLAFWDLFEAEDKASRAAVDAAVAASRPVKFAARRKGPLGELVPSMLVVLRPAGDAITTRVPVGIPGFAPFGEAEGAPGAAAPPSNLWFASLRSAEAPQSYPASQKTSSRRAASSDTSRRGSSDSQAAPIVKGGALPVTPKGVVLSTGRRRQASEDSAASTISATGSATAAAALALPPLHQSSSAAITCARPHRHLPEVTPSEMLPYGMILPERYTDMLLGPLLGVGALGRVHRAVWRGRLVAVKLIELPLHSPGWAHVERAVKNGAISTDLHHPNVVQTLDFAHSRRAVQAPPPAATAAFGSDWLAEPTDEMNCVWLVSELADRGKLADALDRGWLRCKRAPDAAPHLPTLLRTGADIAAALAFLHSHGIIHGGLTYNNVLLTGEKRDPRGWTAKVGDFGLAELVADAAQNSGHYGWAAHAAPEALLRGEVSAAGDVYSLGVLLWEMWTGTRAWCGAQAERIAAAAESGDGLNGLPEDAPATLRALAARCLVADPAGRPSAAEVCVEMQAMLLEASAPLAPEKGGAAE